MSRSARVRQVLTSLAGTAALFCASQILLAVLYRCSGLFGGCTWDLAREGGGPLVVPVASYPWARWCAFLLATAAFPLAWETLVNERSTSEIGFRRPEALLREATIAVFSTGVFLVCIRSGLRIFGRVVAHTLASGNLLFFSLQWGVTAVGEETLYRGVLQRRLCGAFGLLTGILVASVVWALIGHIRAPALENIVLRFPAGLLFGYLYVRSKSLCSAILAHWAINMAVTAGLRF